MGRRRLRRTLRRNRLRPPPTDACSPTAPMSIDAALATPDRIYSSSSQTVTNRTFAATATRNRSHFNHEMEAHMRNEEIAQAVRERTRELQEIIATCDLERLRSYIQEKHRWREGIAAALPDSPRICAHPDCIASRVEGSEYCVAHIMQDPNQKLFVKCGRCGRVFPKCGSCFICPRE
jgi:hypothetical protein